MPYKDPEKRREYNRRYQKKHYKKNKAYYYNKAREREQKAKEFIHKYKEAKGKCEICGFDHVHCLDFHHVNPEEKKANICDMHKNGWSEERMLEELNKCILVCANCHRQIHWEKKRS